MKKKEMAKMAKKKVREQKVKNKLQKEREQLRAVRKHLEEEDKPQNKGVTIYREALLDELLEELETRKNTAKEKLKHNALILQVLEEERRKTETE